MRARVAAILQATTVRGRDVRRLVPSGGYLGLCQVRSVVCTEYTEKRASN